MLPSPQSIIPEYVPPLKYGNWIVNELLDPGESNDVFHIDLNTGGDDGVGVIVGVGVWVGVSVNVGVGVGVGAMVPTVGVGVGVGVWVLVTVGVLVGVIVGVTKGESIVKLQSLPIIKKLILYNPYV